MKWQQQLKANRWVRSEALRAERARIRRAGLRDLRGCAPCDKKMLAKMRGDTMRTPRSIADDA